VFHRQSEWTVFAKPLLLSLGYRLQEDGGYVIEPSLRTQLIERLFFANSERRLSQAIADSCGPLVVSLGLAYADLALVPLSRYDQPDSSALVKIRWVKFPEREAAAILASICSKCKLDESPVQALEHILTSFSVTTFRVDKPGYELKLGRKPADELKLGRDTETMTWTTFDDLETPQHICSVSCFSIRGSVIEPPTLVCGTLLDPLTFTSPEPTRKDDRDKTLSWAKYGEQGMTQAFKGARFQNLDPKSNLGETLSMEFLNVAKEVRASIPQRRKTGKKNLDSSICWTTFPAVKIVAVHKILDADRSAIHELRKEQITLKRGSGKEDVNEQLMFHGSSLSGVVGIAECGAVLRARNAEQFGIGFYG
jgi:hypothetical protein